MTYYQNIDASYKILQEGIKMLVQEREYELTLSREQDYPLLILETRSDATGFVIINDTPETSFKSAYNAFQKLYRDKHNLWRERNLSFVVCRSEHSREHDAFFTALETDVYFCRKYVVFLTDDVGQLQKELNRLPFFPLPEGRAGGVARPASAQTFLQNLGTGAHIARQIVVPREYSASRIAADFVQAGQSLPALNAEVRTDGIQLGGPDQQTRIKNVTIEAFRAYRNKQTFDVDADVVVLYGPNGMGKTSFFDALDYVCTGRIGRLYRRRMRAADFAAIARHLEAPPKAGSVSIDIHKGETIIPVTRKLSDWSHAHIGVEMFGRADTLQFLTSAEWGEERARIESLERLFRATHLFSQSTLELLIEFEQDSTISFDLVSRMLALDDYASALKKVDGVLTELDKQIEQSLRDASKLDTAFASAREKITALQETPQPGQAGNHLSEMAKTLIQDLWSEAGIKIDREEATTESTREWRSMVESVLKASQDDATLAQRLTSDFAQFDQDKARLQDVASKIIQCEADLAQVEPKLVQDKTQLQELTEAIETERNALKQFVKRETALSRLNDLRDQFNRAKRALLQWNHADSEAGSAIESLAGRLTLLMSEAETHESRIAELRVQIQTTVETCQRLEAIRHEFPAWNSNRMRVVELEKAIAERQEAINSLGTEIKTLTSQIAETNQQLTASEHAYTSFAAGQEKLTGLLDQIEVFVENGICPTCGTAHGSKEALLEKIHAQKKTRPDQIEALAKVCSELRVAVKGVQKLLTMKEREKQNKIKERAGMTQELTTTSQAMATFQNRAAEASLDIDADLPEMITAKTTEAIATLQAQQTMLKDIEAKLTEIRKQVSVLETQHKERIEAQKKAALAITPLEQTVSACRAKAQSLDVSLEMQPDETSALITAVQESRIKIEQRVAELRKQKDPLERTVKTTTKHLKGMKAKMTSFRKRQSELQAAVQRYEESAAPLLKADALSRDTVEERRRLTQERTDSLNALWRRCLNLERSLNAAQRSAALAELEAESTTLTMHKAIIGARVKQEAAAKNWSEAVKAALEKQNSHAVADHIDSLGPLTTLIQQRLRAVYGFGDVRLIAKSGQVHVQVRWREQHYKPADYFSDSQKQILMLSIFLAGRLTQTWSGFAPILLDDPVTHFDDLNAFGFVELIRGLVSTLPGKRQFFISTCEDRLFELMRRKFSGVTGGAHFYRFVGIDGDGPVVETVG